MWQNQASQEGASNYFSQYLWDVTTRPCPWYLFGLNIKIPSYQYKNSHYKIRRSHDSLIFEMIVSIPKKTLFTLRRGPGPQMSTASQWWIGVQFVLEIVVSHCLEIYTPGKKLWQQIFNDIFDSRHFSRSTWNLPDTIRIQYSWFLVKMKKICVDVADWWVFKFGQVGETKIQLWLSGCTWHQGSKILKQ